MPVQASSSASASSGLSIGGIGNRTDGGISTGGMIAIGAAIVVAALIFFFASKK